MFEISNIYLQNEFVNILYFWFEIFCIQSILVSIPGKTDAEKLQNSWTSMQAHVNCVVDSDLDKLSQDKYPGIKQVGWGVGL